MFSLVHTFISGLAKSHMYVYKVFKCNYCTATPECTHQHIGTIARLSSQTAKTAFELGHVKKKMLCSSLSTLIRSGKHRARLLAAGRVAVPPSVQVAGIESSRLVWERQVS